MNYEPYNWSEGEEILVGKLRNIEKGVENIPKQEDLLFVEEASNKVKNSITFIKDLEGLFYVFDKGGRIDLSSYFNSNQYLNAYNLRELILCAAHIASIKSITLNTQLNHYYFVEGQKIIFNDLSFLIQFSYAQGSGTPYPPQFEQDHLIIKRTIPTIAHVEDSTKFAEDQTVSLICINPLTGEEVEIAEKVDITVSRFIPHHIKIITIPRKINYIVGENIDLTGIEIQAYDEKETSFYTIPIKACSTSISWVRDLDSKQEISVFWDAYNLKDDFTINVEAVPNEIVPIGHYHKYPFYYPGETIDISDVKISARVFVPLRQEHIIIQDIPYDDLKFYNQDVGTEYYSMPPGKYNHEVNVEWEWKPESGSELEPVTFSTKLNIIVEVPDWGEVSWGTSSDRLLVTTIKAAREGIIDLQEDCGWRIGDIRRIKTSSIPQYKDVTTRAQEVELVITSFDHYKKHVNNQEELYWVEYENILQFDFRNCLENKYRINNSRTPINLNLSELEIEKILNNLIKGPLKEILIPMTLRENGGDWSEIVLYLSNRDKYDILNLPYYQEEEHRKKKIGSEYADWWLDVREKSHKMICNYVTKKGEVGTNKKTYYESVTEYKGLAPFGLM